MLLDQSFKIIKMPIAWAGLACGCLTFHFSAFYMEYEFLLNRLPQE